MNDIEVGGLRIAFERRGSGPPLVLLHGALSDRREWRRQLDALSDEFTVVAWDAPGCGRSSEPPETFRLSDYADMLAAFVRALELDRPHVLGISFGGGLALELYGRHPDVPRTLVLVSAYAGWAGSLPRDEVRERLERGMRQSDQPPDQVVSAWLPSLFSEAAPRAAVDEAAAVMADFHPAGMRAMLRAFAEADLRDVLPRIDVPTLLLYGGEDKRSPVKVARELHAAIPNSTLVVLPGIGHVVNLEAPETFNREVRNFLKSHPD